MTAPVFALPNLDDPVIAPFWQAAAQGALHLPRCTACGAFTWYPAEFCRACGKGGPAWTPVSGKARLFSWAVVGRALHPAYAAFTPYISIIAEPIDAPGVRLVSRLIDADPKELMPGAALRTVFKDLAYPGAISGVIAPLFTLDQERGQ